MSGNTKKREVPAALQTLLKFDVFLTNKVCNWSSLYLPLQSMRVYYKALEWSCHGIIWICGWLAFIWLFNSPELYQLQVNFFLGLLLDLVIIGITKAITRRRRPSANKSDMFATIGPDKFSFPSGHASRAFFVAYFFAYLYPIDIFVFVPLVTWATAVSASRILLRRHHLMDVLAGCLLGNIEGILLSWIWLSQKNSAWIVSMISDEKFDGASYDV